MLFSSAWHSKRLRSHSADAKTSTSSRKIDSLDSVRGIAALSVVVWHFVGIFFPAMFGLGIAGIVQHTGIDTLIYRTPLGVFFAGDFAVTLFFILSGFVLTLRFFAGQQQSLFTAAFKRYARLMPVVFISVISGYILLSLGLYNNTAEVAIATNSTWVNGFFAFEPSLLHALFQGTIGIFATQTAVASSYNPVLWTIYYELLGSILVFGLASLARGHSKRWILYTICVIAFLDTYFVGFIVGMVLADLYATRNELYSIVRFAARPYRIFLLILALCFASYPPYVSPEGIGRYWTTTTLIPTNPALSRTVAQILAGAILIVLALSWPKLKALLEHRILTWLGRISYALYAMHYIIIYSFGIGIFWELLPRLGYVPAALLTTVISIPFILLISVLVHKYIERPSIVFANRVGYWAKK